MDRQRSNKLYETAPAIDRLDVYQQLIRQAVIIRIARVALRIDHDLGDVRRVGLNLLLIGRHIRTSSLEPRSQRRVLVSLVLELGLQFQDPFPQSIVFLLNLVLSDTGGQEAGRQEYHGRLIRRASGRHV